MDDRSRIYLDSPEMFNFHQGRISDRRRLKNGYLSRIDDADDLCDSHLVGGGKLFAQVKPFHQHPNDQSTLPHAWMLPGYACMAVWLAHVFM